MTILNVYVILTVAPAWYLDVDFNKEIWDNLFVMTAHGTEIDWIVSTYITFKILIITNSLDTYTDTYTYTSIQNQ